MGYAEFLLAQIQEKNVSPLTAYGCLVCVKRFGAHITARVLIPKLKDVVKVLRA